MFIIIDDHDLYQNIFIDSATEFDVRSLFNGNHDQLTFLKFVLFIGVNYNYMDRD